MYLRQFRNQEEVAGGEVTPKTYTEAEVEEIRKKIAQQSRSAGYNDARSKALDPFTTIVRSTQGFEDLAELNPETFAEIMGLASARKKNAHHDVENQRKVDAFQKKADDAERKYKDSQIRAALLNAVTTGADGKPKSNNPQQVVKLLRTDYTFDWAEEGGKEFLRVLGEDGQPLRKANSMYEYATVEEIADEFLSKNLHFVPGEARVSTGATQRTGSPSTSPSLEALAQKPVQLMTPEEKKVFMEKWKTGEIDPVRGKVLR